MLLRSVIVVKFGAHVASGVILAGIKLMKNARRFAHVLNIHKTRAHYKRGLSVSVNALLIPAA